MKNSSLIIFIIAIVFMVNIGMASKCLAQTCTITTIGCPTNLAPVCANKFGTNTSGTDGFGADVVWPIPDFIPNCSGVVINSNFFMAFELPEVKWACWNFNRVQRVGSDAGKVNLWQSTGTGDPSILTPLVYIQPAIDVKMDIVCSAGDNFTWSLFLVQGGTETYINQVFVNTSGTYTIPIPSTISAGVYMMKYVFSSTLPGISNKNQIDNIYFDGLLMETGACAEGIDFNVTGPTPGFYLPGTYPMVYTATYTSAAGVITTTTCNFNVVVNALPTIDTTTPASKCGAGTITLGATSSSGSTINWYTNSTGGILLGTGTSFITPSISTTTTFYAEAKNTATGCVSSSRIGVVATIDQAITAITGQPVSVCQSPSPFSILLIGSGIGGSATTGAWSITNLNPANGGANGTLSTTTQTSSPSTVTYTPPANYTGTVTLTLTTDDPVGMCDPITAIKTITVNPLLPPSLIYHF